MKVWILGIGMGPAHVTAEVASALRSADYVVASEKSSDDGLLALRRTIVDTYAPSIPIVAVADPARDRSPGLTEPGYAHAVADWHAARAQRYADVLRSRGGTAAFLVWGDPALYDSTIRIVERVKALGVELDYDVLPGISAPQLLAARHRIVLHEVGSPVHITTGRRLAEAVAAGQDNIVAMLNPDRLDLSAVADWTIWWGANLGASGERLVTGRVCDVVEEITAARDAARAEAGWVMDVFLVRRT
ncbi:MULTISPECIES: precorrin-6A synthase (deacetylating) [Mycolicibacter]|uniref:precorrin-6A synthase (deacetylating) n=1 Tax=Mycolicibacter TaxID=1073531 RepID=UPI0007EB3F0C|nr:MULTISPECIES: precorrin-6A synthase (deacetylating) [Mycolicibacter]OBG36580.1 precorrin-6A synthase (deacetylating) [Mycolicibacter heraklionensis]OBJ32577.1 precorrin-6A synthase (deacetylating) [Mycolicibacter heraklionensis]ULP46686.1 precorrin-6A synthase (deacetylating) [Mycolicibacter virginiensis]